MQSTKKGRVSVVKTGALLCGCCLLAAVLVTFRGGAKEVGLLTEEMSPLLVLVELSEKKSQAEAGAFCLKEYGTKLAAVKDSASNDAMAAALKHFSQSAWISVGSSLWSKWKTEGEHKDCAQMEMSGFWTDVACDAGASELFFCEAPSFYVASAVRIHDAVALLLPESATREASEQQCAEHDAYGLYSIEDAADNARVWKAVEAVGATEAWIGLKSEDLRHYAWEDDSDLDFDEWGDFSTPRAYVKMSGGKWLPVEDWPLRGVVCDMHYEEAPTTPAPAIPIIGDAFQCDDNCLIPESAVGDDVCDCGQCEDEPEWDCETCGDCPTECGSKVECELLTATTKNP